MVANELFANALLVEVAGTALPRDVAALLSYAYIDDSRNVADRFVLHFRDPDRTVLAKGGFTIGVEVRLRVQTSDPGAPVPLMTGEVTAVERELDSSGTVTEVRGLDHAHRLFRGRRVAAYPNMTLTDVVRAVARRAGLRAGTIDPVGGVGRTVEEQFSQDNVSDWSFLTRLADLVGAQVMVSDGALHFRLPERPAGAPSPSTKATQDPLVLEAGRNLISLRAGVSAADQVPEVTVRGWDVDAKRALTASARPRAAGTEVPGVDPVGMGRRLSAPPYAVTDPTLGKDAEVRAVATATADQLGGGAVELDGVARGNPRLRAGAAVALANVGEPFQGKYTLTSTRHVFSAARGYTTAFVVSGRADRSLLGLAGAGGGAGGAAAAAGGSGGGGSGGGGRAGRVATGLLPAIVSDAKDPRKLGRVRLAIPWLDPDFTTGWARVVQLGAGKNRGLVLLPEVGDEVLVGFSGASLDSAFVIGGLYNGEDTPPRLGAEAVDASSGEIVGRALVSRTGHRLELTEPPAGPDGVLLATGDGKLLLRLDEKGRLVELSSEGKVRVTAREGISVDAGNGPLELSGQKVTVTARGDVGVEATGRVAVKGTAGVAVEGATVKVAGQGAAELTAAGAVTVRGIPVRIN